MTFSELRTRGEYFIAYKLINIAITISIITFAFDLLQREMHREPSETIVLIILVAAAFISDYYPFKPIKTPKQPGAKDEGLKGGFAYAFVALVCVGLPYFIFRHFLEENFTVVIWLTASVALCLQLAAYRFSAVFRRWTDQARDL